MKFEIKRNNKFIYIFLILCISLFSGCENFNFGGDIKGSLEGQLYSTVSYYESIESDSPHTDKTYRVGETVSKFSFPQYEKDDYMVVGWNVKPEYRNINPAGYIYDSRARIISMTVGPDSVALYAMWAKKCNIDFVTNCDETIESIVVPYGDPLDYEQYLKWCSLKKEGYNFKGWCLDPETQVMFDPYSPVTGDMTLYAKWAPIIKVTYHSNNGLDQTYLGKEEEYQIEYYNFEDYMWEERAGYGFVGWARSPSATTPDYYYFDNINNITECLDVYAVWSEDVVSVTYYDKENDSRTQVVHYGRGAHFRVGNYYTTDRTRNISDTWRNTGREIKGFDLSSSADSENLTYDKWGWYKTGQNNDPFITTGITADTSIYAYWGVKIYHISFKYQDKNGEYKSYGEEQQVEWNNKPTCPAGAPEIPGYTFEGWYERQWYNGNVIGLKSTPFDFDIPLTETTYGGSTWIDLYAKYTPGGNAAGYVTISVQSNSDIWVSWTRSENIITFTAQDEYDSYEWYIDGVVQTAYNNDSSVSVDTSTWTNGLHDIMLIVTSGGNVYSYYCQVNKY